MIREMAKWPFMEVLKATGGRLASNCQTGHFSCISTDSRTIQDGALFVAIAGDNYDGHYFLDAAASQGATGALVNEAFVEAHIASHVVLQEGIKKSTGSIGFTGLCLIAVPDTLKALGDLAAYRRKHSNASVVAITGTNGKTTTKEMTASILARSFSILKTEGNFNNLVGLPHTLLRLSDNDQWAVLEIAMNRPGEIRRLAEICRPQVGVITNIGAGHLEGLGDIDGVMRAKGELLEQMTAHDTAVLNHDDSRCRLLANQFCGRVITFGIQRGADVLAESISMGETGCSFSLNCYGRSIRVGLRNPDMGGVYNALAAAAVGHCIGVPLDQIKQGLEDVTSAKGRMDMLAMPQGIHVVNDTYNANPNSMSLAIETLSRLKGEKRGVFVLGDMLELGHHAEQLHEEVGRKIANVKDALLFVTGQYCGAVKKGATHSGMAADNILTGSQQELMDGLKTRLSPGDWILVKGSRRMAMEKVVDGLRTWLKDPDSSASEMAQLKSER